MNETLKELKKATSADPNNTSAHHLLDDSKSVVSKANIAKNKKNTKNK
jgi:hypothetical protein